jgi:hypothetical protein
MKLELLILGAFAIVMLAIDRMLRIQPLLDAHGYSPKRCPNGNKKEAFQSPVQVLNIPCGVAFDSCPEGSHCGNGFCVATMLRPLKENCPLPVLP